MFFEGTISPYLYMEHGSYKSCKESNIAKDEPYVLLSPTY